MISIFCEVRLGSAPVDSSRACRSASAAASALEFVDQRLHHVGLGDDADDLAADEQVTLLLAGGNADVGLAGLAGSVDDAAHDRHLDRQVELLQRLLGLLGHGDDVDLGPAARRAGDEVEALALPQAQGLEQLASGPGLFDRVRRQREADGVTDALGQEGTDAGRALDQAGGRWARLGHAEVQRVVEGLRGEPVGGDHQRHRGRLHGDLHVGEVDLFEEPQLVAGRLHQCLGGGAAVLLVQIGVQRPGVDADADGHAAVAGLGGHLLDLRLLAQVARVQAQALHTGFERGQGHFVVEVDVGHDRHGRARDDVGQALGRRLLVAGAAHDVGTGRRQGVNLGQCAVDVRRLGRRHRLHGDGRTVTDGHTAQRDAAGGSSGREERGGELHGQCGICSGWVMSRYMAERDTKAKSAMKTAATGNSLVMSAR
jgi:hypothetical protein